MKIFRQFFNESKNERINDFINFVKNHLELNEMPKIVVIDNPNYSIQNRTFGSYDLNNDVIRVQTAQRHPMDIYRTLAHELVHYKQKCSGKEMDGGDGSDIENEANATAAIILRQYSHKIPNHGY